MARRLSSFPKDMPLLNQHMLDFERVQKQVQELQKQLDAIIKRLKDASIP